MVFIKKHRFISVVGFLAIAIVVSLGIFYSNSEKKDIKGVRTQASLTTQELFLQLQEGKNSNVAVYIEKVIEVKGTIKDITLRNGVYSIILNGSGDRHIICEMQINQNPKVLKFKSGEKIVVKGILKGFLLDAILLNCIVV